MPVEVRMSGESQYGVYYVGEDLLLNERDFGDLIFSTRMQADAVSFAINTEIMMRGGEKSVSLDDITAQVKEIKSQLEK